MAVEISSLQSLRLWFETSLAMARDDQPDLSVRQMTILLAVYLQPPPHTVRGLAEKLKVTKPVITRALDSMGRLGLVNRMRDPQDGRNVLVKRTVEGALFVERLGDLVVSRAARLPN